MNENGYIANSASQWINCIDTIRNDNNSQEYGNRLSERFEYLYSEENLYETFTTFINSFIT